MQKLQLEQKLAHKLSGQQIQFIKLLQLPTMALDNYITKEIAVNPLLEDTQEVNQEVVDREEDEILMQEYTYGCPIGSYPKTEARAARDTWTPAILSFQEKLQAQLQLLHLSEIGYTIGEYLIGSLDEEGFLPYDLEIIVQDLHVMYYLEVSLEEVEQVLRAIQSLDPPGIAARNLQECLLLQLQAQNQLDPVVQLAYQVVSNCFQAFTKKHYAVIVKKLGITNKQLLKEAFAHITRLSPKPVGVQHTVTYTNEYLSPDFMVVEKEGKLVVELLYYPTYKPCLNQKYLTMLQCYEQKAKQDVATQEMVAFLKKKLEDAKWFMEALSQRSQTLLKTMEAIVALQTAFFLEGEEVDKLRPMILQHVADKVAMDASTISRIVNQKSVQGKFGIYPLKFFFSEGLRKVTGEDVSNKAIKKRILELIDSEDKGSPYPDGHIEALLIAEGYSVARRTVAKYREQLNLPVARLRKALV
ncbi:MAG: RNA polymerase factor sigma-54 [Candidatus Cardinium sp.]|nr:RNA polymerase factor sigma-54 [Candidatus Cardinium sp.]